MEYKTIRQYKSLERSLLKKHREKQDGIITVKADDFKDDKLTLNGYQKLKTGCEFAISNNEELQIVVPERNIETFKDSLENIVAAELIHLSNKTKKSRVTALILLVVGLACYGLGHLFRADDNMVREVTIIAMSGFVWAAIQQWFFEVGKMHDKRKNLILMLTAKITAK